MRRLTVVTAVLIAATVPAQAAQYEATWESIDARPTPQWYDDAKFGIFIHWGVYSVPSWGPKKRYSEWYWNHMQDKDGETWKFHEATYGEDFKYQDFANEFTCEMFDPAQWADIFKRSGAKYVVLTSKHHDGYALWPSEHSWNWNSMDTGPHRDLCGELTDAVKAAGLKMGFYYSLYEWYHPLYRSDVNAYVDQHMLPQIKDLVTRYEPALVWPDGEWDHPSETWRSTEFLAWLFNESAVKDEVAVDDRWGKGCRGVHGGFYTTEYGHGSDKLVNQHKWEECRGIGASFGYNRNENIDEYNTPDHLLELLIDTVSGGGNLLLDIGPTADGRIPVIMQQRLVAMGEWLAVNGEAIYGTQPWRVQREGDLVRYTAKDGAVYAICKEWPGDELVLEGVAPGKNLKVSLVGHEGPVDAAFNDGKLRIQVPRLTIAEVPSLHAHVLKITGVQ
jgi:alpha-L-fucosidase